MNWKTILLGILTLIAGGVFLLITKSVFELQLVWWKAILYPALAIIPFLSLWGLFFYLAKNRWANFVLSLLIGVLAILILSWNYFVAFVVFILVVLGIYAYYQIQSDAKTRIKIALDKSLGSGLKTIFFALALLVAVIFFYTPWAHLYDKGLDFSAGYQMKILSQFIPGLHPGLTVDEMILVFSGIKGEEVKEKLKELSPEQISQLREQSLKQLDLESLGLTGSEKLTDHPEIINTLLGKKIEPIWQKIGPYLPYLLAFGVFEVASILGYLLVPISILLALSIFELLRFLKLIQIKTTPETKELIEF